MIKLLNYEQGYLNVQCNFENNQFVIFYKFGQSIYSNTSDEIGKESIKEIKQKLEREGIKTSLDEFVGQYYKEYGE